MTGADLFDVYRKTLAIVFGSYAIVKTGHLLWNWQVSSRRAGRHEVVFRRYLVTSLLRIRLRRFWFELLQIAVLATIFAYLVGVQARPSTSAPDVGRESAATVTGSSPPPPLHPATQS
ncbi:MAG: hypothetical protein JSV19_05525 [Phycisphaerales bacterium]|nr:MAG: hypothetical protein JSV19_05525 [Phycisphaerales bacterium]